jgi:flagellar motor component MotA
MVKFIISLFLIFFTIAGALLLEGGDPVSYLGITAFIIVFFIPVFASMGVWGLSEIGNLWVDSFSKKKTPTLKVSLKIIDFYEKGFYISGILCTVLGIIFVLAHIEKLEVLGRGLALSFLGILYGLIFGLIARILRARLDKFSGN